MDLQITQVLPAAQPALVEWCATLMATNEPWQTLGRDYAAGVELLCRTDRELYLAQIDTQPAGFVLIAMQGAFVGYLQTIGVAAPYRRHGIGTALMQYAEQRIFRDSPNVFLCVSSFNHSALRLYLRLGYREVGTLHNYIVAGYDELLLRKSIGPLDSFRRA